MVEDCLGRRRVVVVHPVFGRRATCRINPSARRDDRYPARVELRQQWIFADRIDDDRTVDLDLVERRPVAGAASNDQSLAAGHCSSGGGAEQLDEVVEVTEAEGEPELADTAMPRSPLLPETRFRAFAFGLYPSSFCDFGDASLVAGESRPLPLRAFETVVVETPATAATA